MGILIARRISSMGYAHHPASTPVRSCSTILPGCLPSLRLASERASAHGSPARRAPQFICCCVTIPGPREYHRAFPFFFPTLLPATPTTRAPSCLSKTSTSALYSVDLSSLTKKTHGNLRYHPSIHLRRRFRCISPPSDSPLAVETCAARE